MKYDINWDVFKVKNPRYEYSFEEMCRHIFCTKFGKTGYNFQSNYDQTGLEMEPIEYEGLHYGFQSKFVKNSPYKQIEDSLCKKEKAFDIYKGKLDCIYIYTNADIKPIPTDDELEQYNKGIIKNSPRIRIYKMAKENNIDLVYITRENFSHILNEETNISIAAFFLV